MTPEQQAAYVNAQAVTAMITAMSMVAANQERQQHGHSLAYDEAAFVQVIRTHCIDHNEVLSLFHQ